MLQSFLTVGQQILTLYLLLVVGFVLGKVKLLDDRASVALSSLVMYVVSPCMMVVAFQRPLEHTALHNFGVVTGVSAVLHVVFIAAAMLLIHDRDRERQNCLRFAAVFSNCGFMGYPLMAALLGSIGVFYGSAYVIVFTILSWTWGVYVITGDRSQLRLKPLLNPGVISVVLAMALYLGQVTVPEPLMVPINYLADLNTPLPMLVVGYQLSHANFKAALQGISSWVTLVLRLLVLPLASLGICLALNVSHDLTLVLLIAANIALGSVNAFMEGTWDMMKFRNGCIKGGVVAASLIAVYYAGWLNPDLLVIEAEGQTVNLMTAVHIALLAAFTAYAVDVLKKLKDMLSTATPGKEEDHEQQ